MIGTRNQHGDGAPAGVGVAERAAARLYEKHGARSILIVIVVLIFVAMISGFVTVLVGTRYLRASTAELLKLSAIGEVLLVVGLLVALVSTREVIGSVLAWSGDNRTAANAPVAWNAIARAPRVIASRGFAASGVVACSLIPFVVVDLREPAWAAIPVAVGAGDAVAVGGVVAIFLLELSLRPMLAEIAVFLPPEFEPAARGWRLGTKALAPLIAVTLFAGVTIGAFADVRASGPVRLALVGGLDLGIGALVGVVFFIINRSMLHPIAELTAATRRVRAGDLSSNVPVVSADDLGSLASSFNQMLVGLRDRDALRERNEELVHDLQAHAEQLRESRARIVTASDLARRQVERDLHDGAQQHLVLLGLKLGIAQRLIDSDPAAAGTMHEELRTHLERALAELRDLAHGIYPPMLEHEGLPGALAEAARRAAIPATLERDADGRYPPELEAAVYFCCLEALQNAAKHAGEGAHATIRLGERDGALTFEIADDGQGFDVEAAQHHAGVQNMADRVGALGGELRLASSPGHGTTVSGAIPLTG